MACAGRNIDILSRQVITFSSQPLNDIDGEKSSCVTGGFPDALQIGPKTRSKLHCAQCDELRFPVDERDELIKIDPAIAFFDHTKFDTESVPDHPPRIEIGRELACKADNIVASFPLHSIRYGCESVGSISHECYVFRIHLQHFCQEAPRTILRCDPIGIVFRAMAGNVPKLRYHGIDSDQ
jgi:hypothetical protein